jgi:hypothetical protein
MTRLMAYFLRRRAGCEMRRDCDCTRWRRKCIWKWRSMGIYDGR